MLHCAELKIDMYFPRFALLHNSVPQQNLLKLEV